MNGEISDKGLNKEAGKFLQEGLNPHGISPLGNSHSIGAQHQISGQKINAGFFRRSGAFFLDLGVIYLIYLFFLWLAFSAVRLAFFGHDLSGQPEIFRVPFLFTFLFLWLFLFLFYFSFFTYWGGQTPGKKLLGLRIIPRSGGEVSMFQAIGRSLGYLVSFLTGGWGFWLVLFSQQKRSLHDWISGTRVVRLL